MANIYDISEQAGVSIATVSRVLNNKSKVSEKTRKKVLDAMESLDYIPNAFARGLGLNSMKTIGLMVADISDPFFTNAVNCLEKNLRKNGYNSILCCTGFDLKDRQNCLQLLLSRRVDAVVILGSSFNEAKAANMNYIIQAAEKTSIIMLNSYLKHPNVFCIENDDHDVIFSVVKKLIECGREKILYIYQSDTRSSRNKLSGYKDAITGSGRQIDESLIIQGENDITITKNLLLSKGKLDVNAVVASSDLMAVAFVKYARIMGIRLPEDCNVIGYSDSIFATCCEPELSSIDTHLENMCLTAVSSLMQIFKNGKPPNRIVITCNLKTRTTTNIDFTDDTFL